MACVDGCLDAEEAGASVCAKLDAGLEQLAESEREGHAPVDAGVVGRVGMSEDLGLDRLPVRTSTAVSWLGLDPNRISAGWRCGA